jgi:hypothetical protein
MISCVSEWDIEPDYEDEEKDFFFEKIEDLKNIKLDRQFFDSDSVTEKNIRDWQSLIEEVEAEMQKKTLPESVELKKQLDRFNSNMFTIPIEFRDLPIITEYSRPTNGKAIYSFSLCHPVTKEEFIVYKLVNSTPEYSKKGNFKGNYFNSSYVF